MQELRARWKTGNLPGCNFEHASALEKAPDFAGGGQDIFAREVQEIAAELARLTGGIVLDIHEENTIIMYRGKNYSQPPTEIMSPRITLSRKKVLISFFYFTYENWS